MQWVLAIALSFVVVVIGAVVIASAIVIAEVIAAAFGHVRLSFTVKGHGEFGKFWAIAAGGQLRFVTVSYANAHGIDSIFQLHLLGRRVLRISPFGDVKQDSRGKPKRKSRWRKRAEAWFELNDLINFIVDLRHHIHMERFKGRLSYATPDVAVTGMLSGSLFTLAGLMAPFGAFYVEPLWVDVAKAKGNLDMAFRFCPARIVLFIASFILRNIKLRQPSRPRRESRQSTMGGHDAR